MTPDDIANLFTRKTGEYAFARWGRPIAPVVRDEPVKDRQGEMGRHLPFFFNL